MNRSEAELFDEYKAVDNICKDLFSSEKGVSTYIEQMEITPPEQQFMVSGWKDDYYKLKHIRWLRNQIAHSTSAVDCKPADLNWLKGFHQRLINRQDPLALAFANERRYERRVSSANAQTPVYNSANKSAKWIAVAVVCAIAAVLIGAMLYFGFK